MNTKYFRFLALLIFSFVFLNGCTQGKFSKSKDFKHPTPLIKDDIRKKGKEELDRTVEMGHNLFWVILLNWRKEKKFHLKQKETIY